MVLRFIDGFDHYNTSAILIDKWGPGSTSYGSWLTGRYGGLALSIGSSGSAEGYGPNVTFDNQGTWIVGCAFTNNGNFQAGNSPVLLRWYDGATCQAQVTIIAGGAINVYRGAGTTLIASGGTYPTLTWMYVEVMIVFHPSAGSVTVRQNASQVANVSGLNTAPSGNAYASKLVLGQGSGQWCSGLVDDLYVCDGTGSHGNSFLAPNSDGLRVYTSYPTGVGTTTQFTSTGVANNWDAVNDAQHDGDSTYVGSATIGAIDLYALGDLPSSAMAVEGVRVGCVARKDDAGTRSIATLVRSGGTNYPQSTQAITDSYGYRGDLIVNDPATATLWTPSGVNAIEIGVTNVA
jgi:hypothetical protein